MGIQFRYAVMSESEHKTKMISLRLSQVELDFLKTRYRNYGARNVSDFARLAVQRMMHGSDNPGNNIAAKLAALDGRVTALESRLVFLTEGERNHIIKVPAGSVQEEL